MKGLFKSTQVCVLNLTLRLLEPIALGPIAPLQQAERMTVY